MKNFKLFMFAILMIVTVGCSNDRTSLTQKEIQVQNEQGNSKVGDYPEEELTAQILFDALIAENPDYSDIKNPLFGQDFGEGECSNCQERVTCITAVTDSLIAPTITYVGCVTVKGRTFSFVYDPVTGEVNLTLGNCRC